MTRFLELFLLIFNLECQTITISISLLCVCVSTLAVIVERAGY